MTEITLGSLHVTQVGIVCLETIQHVTCLFEVSDVFERSKQELQW